LQFDQPQDGESCDNLEATESDHDTTSRHDDYDDFNHRG
jgi:hypothetical protein